MLRSFHINKQYVHVDLKNLISFYNTARLIYWLVHPDINRCDQGGVPIAAGPIRDCTDYASVEPQWFTVRELPRTITVEPR